VEAGVERVLPKATANPVLSSVLLLPVVLKPVLANPVKTPIYISTF